MKYSISILSSKDRIKDIKKINEINADYLHIDVCDGKFVDNNAFTIGEIAKLTSISNKKLDVHLMMDNPTNYINKLSSYNVSYITIHKEINKDLLSLLKLIRSYGIKSGLAIKPETNIEDIVPYLDYLDLILIMSVNPGYGGQSFIDITDKIKHTREIINNRDIVIEVDGGINDTNINILKDSLVDIVVLGSYITNSNDFKEALNKLKEAN